MLVTNPFLLDPWGENQGKKCYFLFKIVDSTLKIMGRFFCLLRRSIGSWDLVEKRGKNGSLPYTFKET